jgi:hypothetical protein
MKQKIRITTRANQFERRKQEHLQAGYLIEDEQPFAHERVLLIYGGTNCRRRRSRANGFVAIKSFCRLTDRLPPRECCPTKPTSKDVIHERLDSQMDRAGFDWRNLDC